MKKLWMMLFVTCIMLLMIWMTQTSAADKSVAGKTNTSQENGFRSPFVISFYNDGT